MHKDMYVYICVNASQLLNHLSQRRLHAFFFECEGVSLPLSVWLESESILRETPKVSEIATNYWVFSKVWLVTWLYLILLLILG